MKADTFVCFSPLYTWYTVTIQYLMNKCTLQEYVHVWEKGIYLMREVFVLYDGSVPASEE